MLQVKANARPWSQTVMSTSPKINRYNRTSQSLTEQSGSSTKTSTLNSTNIIDKLKKDVDIVHASVNLKETENKITTKSNVDFVTTHMEQNSGDLNSTDSNVYIISNIEKLTDGNISTEMSSTNEENAKMTMVDAAAAVPSENPTTPIVHDEKPHSSQQSAKSLTIEHHLMSSNPKQSSQTIDIEEPDMLPPMPQSSSSSTSKHQQPLPILNPITSTKFIQSKRNSIKPSFKEVGTITVDTVSEKKIAKSKSKLPKFKKLNYFLRATIGLLVGLIMFLGQDWFIQSSISFATRELKEGSLVTQSWADIPIPINVCFYLFGMKNAPAFLHGSKPHLIEHGPFCYILGRKRRVLQFKEHTLTYMERLLFEFNPDISESLDTKFETINLPIFVSVLVAKNILQKFYVGFMGPFIYNSITMTLRASGEQWIETISARQLLVARKVPLLEYVHRLLIPFKSIGIPIPNEFGADGFKLLNHSFGLTTTISTGELGPFEVYSKTEDGHLLGDIISFKELSTFPGLAEPCNRMTGGDGMFWRRPVVDEHLTIFLQPTCGLLPFAKQYEHSYYGAQVVRYKFDDQWFNMSNEDTRCFCTKESIDECNGYHSIAPCAAGVVPMGISLPHFHLSPHLLAKVDGLRPDPQLHSGYLDMEPNFGAPVNAIIGIQAVADVEPVEAVPLMAKLPKLVLPILWVKVSAGADGILGVLLGFGSNFVRYGCYLWLMLGIIYFFVSLLNGIKQKKIKSQTVVMLK